MRFAENCCPNSRLGNGDAAPPRHREKNSPPTLSSLVHGHLPECAIVETSSAPTAFTGARAGPPVSGQGSHMDRQQLAADDALRNLPSHGWTGRRDRALIVLSQVADLPYQRIARLSAGDISFADGAATIDGPDRATTVAPEQQRPAVRSVCARPMAACPRPDRRLCGHHRDRIRHRPGCTAHRPVAARVSKPATDQRGHPGRPGIADHRRLGNPCAATTLQSPPPATVSHPGSRADHHAALLRVTGDGGSWRSPARCRCRWRASRRSRTHRRRSA